MRPFAGLKIHLGAQQTCVILPSSVLVDVDQSLDMGIAYSRKNGGHEAILFFTGGPAPRALRVNFIRL